MNIPGLFLFLLIIFAIIQIHTDASQRGGTLPQVTIKNKYTEPYYGRQYRELDDVNNVLNRPILPREENINELQAYNTGADLDGTIVNYAKLKEPLKRYLDFSDIVTRPTNGDTKVLVEDKQPYFLEEAKIIDYYGKKFYYDARFPRNPISIEFAKDPAKFCREHPDEYPSYVIAARNFKTVSSQDALYS